MSEADKRVLPVANLREFFKDSLHGALTKQRVSVEDQTEHYVVNVLTLFARSEALYDSTPEGMRLRPLVALLGEALEATCRTERNRALQRLGEDRKSTGLNSSHVEISYVVFCLKKNTVI